MTRSQVARKEYGSGMMTMGQGVPPGATPLSVHVYASVHEHVGRTRRWAHVAACCPRGN